MAPISLASLQPCNIKKQQDYRLILIYFIYVIILHVDLR